MRKALFLIGGITPENSLYAEKDLYNLKSLWNLCQYTYSLVTEINTNRLRDESSWRKIFDWALGSKLADPVKLRLSGDLRREIKEEIENTITLSKDMIKTLVAHSQGTIEVLISKIVINTLILCGSPLGFCTPYGRWSMRNIVHRFFWSKPTVKCKKLIYLFSSNDPVSMFAPSKEELKKFVDFEELEYLDTELRHDFTDFLKVIEEKKYLTL